MISIDALVPLLLPSQTDICVEDIVLDDPQHVIIQASASPTTATCPSCGQSTTRIHSRYTRTLADVPWATIAVSLRLHVRKFVCMTPSCSRRIFTERLPSVMMPWSRRTARLAAHQRQIGLVVGSAAGARLGTALDQGTGRTTLLRLMRRAELPEAPAPRVIGIDEFALRKGQQYSTLIVDLERGEVVDVLPDRSEEAVAAWLRAHPGVEVVSRDRATVYAEGTRAGAPDAIHVTWPTAFTSAATSARRSSACLIAIQASCVRPPRSLPTTRRRRHRRPTARHLMRHLPLMKLLRCWRR